jgi:DNA-binding CsgD family transcriptional regulator
MGAFLLARVSMASECVILLRIFVGRYVLWVVALLNPLFLRRDEYPVSATLPEFLEPPSPSTEAPAGWLELNAKLASSPVLLRTLSRAERLVAVYVGLGLTNKEVAIILAKSPLTVKTQLSSILDKLEMPNRGRLIAWLHLHAPAPSPLNP